jgi:hypothetical protein
MKYLADLLTPRGGFDDKTETVESLGSLMKGSLKPEWLEANYPTKNLQTVVETVFARLDGRSGTMGYHLAQSMGGGKTHTLLCLGLLSSHPKLIKKYFPAVTILNEEPVKVVCIDGRENHPNGVWGTIAKQLGKEKEFAEFYSPLRDPGPEDWRKLLNGERLLILMDELPYYLDKSLATSVSDSNLCKVTAKALTALVLACAEGSETRQVALVMTDLNADAYPDGSSAIQQVTTQVIATLGDETDKFLETLQPIELETNDLYHILRKRLFKEDPAAGDLKAIAEAYREALRKAATNHYCTGDPTTLSKDIEETYPFSPAIKHLAARFRENSGFQQTRGMIRLFSKVVKEIYESGEANKITLIGPEHINMGSKPVREVIKKINRGMENAISKDFYQDGGTANLQQIKDEGTLTKDVVNDAARIILFASLSQKDSELGLTPQQLGTWYASPDRDITMLSKIWEKLEDTCDYLHRTDPDNKLLFRPIENILVWVRRRAAEIAETTVRKRLAAKLEELFKSDSGSVYQRVEPFPSIADLVLEKDRTTLVILSPQQQGALPQEAQDYWKGQRYKNRVIFLTGLKGGFANLSEHTRKIIAAEEGLARKDVGATERRMLDEQLERAMSAFREAMIHCFDTVFYPIDKDTFDRASFRMEYADDSYKGARQVTSVMQTAGKYLPWEESNAASNRDYAQEELFDSKVMRWADVKENAAIRPSWVMTTSNWLDELKFACTASDWWRDVGADQVEKGPFERKTTISLIPLGQREGIAKISIKPTPQGAVVKWSPGETFDPLRAQVITDPTSFETTELKCVFRCEDPDGQWKTGDDARWTGKPELKRGANPRPIEFQATHGAEIFYTTDGSKPEPGASSRYLGPITPPADCTLVQGVAVVDGIISDVLQVKVAAAGAKPKKGKVRYRSGSLNAKGPSQINAAISNLAAVKGSVESATVRFTLQSGGAIELQLQETSFDPAALKTQVDAVVTSLAGSAENGEERLLELMQVFFPSVESFEEWVKKQGVRYKEDDLDYVD